MIAHSKSQDRQPTSHAGSKRKTDRPTVASVLITFSRAISYIAIAGFFAAAPARADDLSAGDKAYAAGRFDKAYAKWQPLADRNVPAAEWAIGMMWRRGQVPGETASKVTAEIYMERAARHGLVPAMTDYALVRLDAGDRTESVAWLTLAARYNNAPAIYDLKQLGEPVPRPDLYIAQEEQEIAAEEAQIAATDAILSARPIVRPTPPPPLVIDQPRPNIRCTAEPVRDYKGDPVFNCR